MRYFADATELVALRDIAPSSLPRIGPGREAIRVLGRHEVEDDRPERNEEAGELLHQELTRMPLKLVVNQARNEQEARGEDKHGRCEQEREYDAGARCQGGGSRR